MIAEVLRLKALMGDAGVRKIAATFNRLHGARISIGKTFVADVLISHQYELTCAKRNIHNKPPTPYRVNAVWALDLTFYTDATKNMHTVLGVIDHGSRLVTSLKVIINKRAWTILGHLCLAMGQHGRPKAIRTDNEGVFNCWIFKAMLKCLGIRHQQSQICCPWQNGRIERLFGTLKPLLRQLILPNGLALESALAEFTLFYNFIRPHQNLAGLTPVDAWQGRTWTDIQQSHSEPIWVEALDGLLAGYYLRQ
ncbi:integrase core domain-containing protein [Iodobacter arcticus]|uniref:Integrase core domain-containing protein n=1 Tax=Iodobacter arcticus TaxID=590593 RepID=A0ABW2R321_9NEIS